MYPTPTDFIASLPELINSIPKPLHAFFVTYNHIVGFDDGEVKLKNTDVSVFVQSGLHIETFMQSFGEKRKEACKIVQEEVFQKISSLVASNKGSIFAIVYAGVHVFTEALDWAALIKKSRKDTYVFVLTCDCSFLEKRSLLEIAKDTHNLDGYMVTEKCGGLTDMTDILKSFLDIVEK